LTNSLILDDPFFIDVEETNEPKSKKPQKQIKFQPYEQRQFLGSGQKFDIIKKKVGKVRYGPEVSTPTLDEQKELDPTNWSNNPNFIPIPKESNKLYKVKIATPDGNSQNWEKYLNKMQKIDEFENDDMRK
jgi:hypothetical protein